jgi:ABC-2 type transport system permease protein
MTALRAFRAELIRVRTTRTPLALAAGTAVLVVVGTAAAILSLDRGELAAGTPHALRVAFGAAGAGWIFVLALGVLASAGEYRHGTVTASFLASPSRGGRLVGKMLAHALVGAVFAAGAAAVTVAVALPWARHRGAPVGIGSRELWLVVGGSVLTTALYGPIGVAVGSLLRNQVAALLSVLAWGLVLEPVVLGVWPGVGRYLPNGAASALSRGGNEHLLSMGAGGALFLGYVLAIAVACAALDARRDVVAA